VYLQCQVIFIWLPGQGPLQVLLGLNRRAAVECARSESYRKGLLMGIFGLSE